MSRQVKKERGGGGGGAAAKKVDSPAGDIQDLTSLWVFEQMRPKGGGSRVMPAKQLF